jgi:hypothetical protein
MMDLMAQGAIASNLITLKADLIDVFDLLWIAAEDFVKHPALQATAASFSKAMEEI